MIYEALSKVGRSGFDHQGSGLESSAPPTNPILNNAGISHQGSASIQQAPPTYHSSALDCQGSTLEPSGAVSTQTIGNLIDFENSAIKRYLDNIWVQQRMNFKILEQNLTKHYQIQMKKVADQAQHIVEKAQTQVVQYQNQYQAQCEKIEALEAQVNMLAQAINRSINTNNMTQEHNYSIPPPIYAPNSSLTFLHVHWINLINP